jgi:CheY-like chemotaxis protein
MAEKEIKKIVLAVDDMPINLATMRSILQNDFDIRLSKSANTALVMLNTFKVDLILLDIEMPEMSGFEFLNRIRNNADHPEQKDIPVIFVTSHSSPDFVSQASAAGAVDYVVKPVIPVELLKKVYAVLEAAEKRPPAKEAVHGQQPVSHSINVE